MEEISASGPGKLTREEDLSSSAHPSPQALEKANSRSRFEKTDASGRLEQRTRVAILADPLQEFGKAESTIALQKADSSKQPQEAGLRSGEPRSPQGLGQAV